MSVPQSSADRRGSSHDAGRRIASLDPAMCARGPHVRLRLHAYGMGRPHNRIDLPSDIERRSAEILQFRLRETVMITRVALTLVLASSTAVAASARGTLASQTQSATVKSPMPSSSEHFLKDTLDDGFWEVEMAKLAQTNSNDDRVQRLGECLQADHEKADYEMRSILLAHNLEARDKI